MRTTEERLLHDHRRDVFRAHRFLGLPHGVAAAGPALFAALCLWRLSLGYGHPLAWLLPIAAYLGALSLLTRLLPRRELLEEMALRAQREARALAAREHETRIDEE